MFCRRAYNNLWRYRVRVKKGIQVYKYTCARFYFLNSLFYVGYVRRGRYVIILNICIYSACNILLLSGNFFSYYYSYEVTHTRVVMMMMTTEIEYSRRGGSGGGLNNNRKSNGRSQPTAVTGLPPPNITRTAHQRLYYHVHYNNIFNIIYTERAPTTITTASRKRVIYTL